MNIYTRLALSALLFSSAAIANPNRATSCVGRCGDNDGTTGCQCNVVCSDFGDCCSDYESVCYSCTDRCGDPYIYTAPCACNDQCSAENDCCSDYSDVCDGSSGGGTGSVTDQQIRDLTEELYSLDSNNLAGSVVIDMQGQTSSGESDDVAPSPLFSSVPSLTGETYVLFEALRDNYAREEDVDEDNTLAEQAEVSAFLDAALATPLFVRLDQFMTDNSLISGTLRENIEEVWFTLYSRASGVLGSSGFEHSFMGETDGGSIGGFHNWVSFYEEEQAGNIDYKGYIEFADFGDGAYVLTDRFTWYDSNKPIGGSYIGTSPEYDLAIFTLCFFTRPNSECSVQVNGVEHYIQTWEQQYNGQTLVGSAYPGV